MRLAYLVSRYPAISHTFILREVLGLRELGFEISTASINDPDRPEGKLTAEERGEAGKTFYVKRAGAVGAGKALLAAGFRHPVKMLAGLRFAVGLAGTDVKKVVYAIFYFFEALLVGNWMRREKVSHLHVHFATPAATVGLITARMFPIGFSFTVHGPDEFYDAPGYRLTEKIEGADFVCCIGAYARSQLMKLSDVRHWSKFEIVPLGVDPAAFSPQPRTSDPKPFEIICVGRLVPAKGQHILLEAFARLVAEGRDVRLRFVGDGPDRPSLEKMAAELNLGEKVIFEGAVNQDRIRDLYAGADLFALASFAEGIPVVLMEAMALELPCVTTFITGIPELIRPGVDGLLVPPSDVVGLADAMAELMDDPARRAALAKAGRERVLEKYNLPKNIGKLGEVFKKRLSADEKSH